jgi:dephospho-CoA kinase
MTKRHIIGIAGRIASGKNEVCKIMEDRGFIVIDVDLIGHKLLEDDAVKNRLVVAFGPYILNQNKIARKLLADLVFSDKKKLKILEQILHPIMREIIKQQIATDNKSNILINGAMLFKMGLDELAEEIWIVDADDKIIEKRLHEKGFTMEAIRKRFRSQMSRANYKKKADIIITNNGSIDELESRIQAIMATRNR